MTFIFFTGPKNARVDNYTSWKINTVIEQKKLKIAILPLHQIQNISYRNYTKRQHTHTTF